jgi:hypothetical protein
MIYNTASHKGLKLDLSISSPHSPPSSLNSHEPHLKGSTSAGGSNRPQSSKSPRRLSGEAPGYGEENGLKASTSVRSSNRSRSSKVLTEDTPGSGQITFIKARTRTRSSSRPRSPRSLTREAPTAIPRLKYQARHNRKERTSEERAARDKRKEGVSKAEAEELKAPGVGDSLSDTKAASAVHPWLVPNRLPQRLSRDHMNQQDFLSRKAD